MQTIRETVTIATPTPIHKKTSVKFIINLNAFLSYKIYLEN